MNIRFIYLIVLISLSTGCSLEATLLTGTSSTPTTPIPSTPDALHGTSGLSYGEKVITTAGTPQYELIGAFAEVPEKTSSLNNNNWIIEGTFYE